MSTAEPPRSASVAFVAAYDGERAAATARRIALILFVVLLAPGARHVLEASMLAQMLVQIPLLAIAGGLARAYLPPPLRARIRGWNASGIAGFVVVSVAGMYWMLPRSLDAAVADPLMNAAKFVSVPLAIGLPLALSWPCAGFVARGVFVAEAIATLFRVGWLYRISTVRLCSAYPLADQQRLGTCMLVLGGLLFAVVAYSLLFADWSRRPSASTAPRYHRAPIPPALRP